MSYIKQSLVGNERVVFRGAVHWVIFILPVLLMALALWFWSLPADDGNFIFTFLMGSFLIFYGLWKLIAALVYWLTTEMALTTKRILIKTGLIRRDTMELNLPAFEGCRIEQSVLGRILGYGTLVFTGRGGLENKMRFVVAPLKFRQAALSQAELG